MKTNTQTLMLCSALVRLGTRIATGFDQRFSALDISQAQYRIMLAIDQQDGSNGVTPSTLADQLLIERGTMSVLSNRLVEKGWLERTPGENRRSLRLGLTSKGRRVLEKVFPRSIELADQLLTDFSRKQLDLIQIFLHQVEVRLRENDNIYRKEQTRIKYSSQKGANRA
jgi:DNA-binding MarR family transcriptional regulator